MSKYVKGLFETELTEKFRDVGDFMILDTTGLGGIDNNLMRGALKQKGIKLSVVKNSLMRRSLKGLDKSAAVSLFSAGPCTVAYGGDSVVDVAKEIAGWSKKISAVEIKSAFVDGEAMDCEGAKSLCSMPSRVELQGEVVMLANSPGANLAGAIAGPGGVIAGCIKSLVEKLQEAA